MVIMELRGTCLVVLFIMLVGGSVEASPDEDTQQEVRLQHAKVLDCVSLDCECAGCAATG